MDVFSWFRQKRQGIRPAPFDEIRIPLTPTPTFGLVVYCRLPDDDFDRLGMDELMHLASSWTNQHAAEPLRSAIQEFSAQGLLNLFVHPRDEMPEPPDEILRAYNLGEMEERRFRNATHAIVIGSPDLLTPPRIGLWSVVAAARGLALGLPGGVIVDPEFPRLLPLESLTVDLPSDGHVRVPEHILIPYSSDPETGLLWITTKGMARFGLPEIEIRDSPPNLASNLMPVMNGLAQRLVTAAMEYVDEVESDADPPETLPLRAQFRLGLTDIRAAYSDPEAELQYDPAVEHEVARAETVIRLEMVGRDPDNGSPLCIRVLPPRGLRAAMGVWLNRLLNDLLGSEPWIESVETGDEVMEKAHAAALAELPLVRARFQEVFRSGEVLHIKHGFPTEEAGHEYMWIAVTTWEGGRIRGHIANDPQYRRDLHAGQAVEIGEDEVYDWMIAHTDGRIEGAYTNRALDNDLADDEDMSDEDE